MKTLQEKNRSYPVASYYNKVKFSRVIGAFKFKTIFRRTSPNCSYLLSKWTPHRLTDWYKHESVGCIADKKHVGNLLADIIIFKHRDSATLSAAMLQQNIQFTCISRWISVRAGRGGRSECPCSRCLALRQTPMQMTGPRGRAHLPRCPLQPLRRPLTGCTERRNARRLRCIQRRSTCVSNRSWSK